MSAPERSLALACFMADRRASAGFGRRPGVVGRRTLRRPLSLKRSPCLDDCLMRMICAVSSLDVRRLQHASAVGRSEAIKPSQAVGLGMGEEILCGPGTDSPGLSFVGHCYRELANGGIPTITCNADNRFGGRFAGKARSEVTPVSIACAADVMSTESAPAMRDSVRHCPYDRCRTSQEWDLERAV